MIPLKFEIPSLRLAIQHEMDESGSLQARLPALRKLDETRRVALRNSEVIQSKRKIRRDRLSKLVKFVRGDLVMMVDSWLMKQHGQKFIPKWKGPFVIHEVYPNDTYNISTPDGVVLKKRYNGTKLKVYRHIELQVQDDGDTS
jgi:hypothetical protein